MQGVIAEDAVKGGCVASAQVAEGVLLALARRSEQQVALVQMARCTARARPYGYTALIDPQLTVQITLKPDNCIRGCSMSNSRLAIGTVRMGV